MSKYHDAADALRRHAVKYEGLMSAAKALEEIGSLEQAAEEAQAAALTAKDELKTLQDEVAKAKDALKAKKQKAEEQQAMAKAAAELIVGNAKTAAAEIQDNANALAVTIKSQAQAKADQSLAGASRRAEELFETQRQLTESIAALELTLAAKTQEAEDIEARLAKAQAQIAKLLG